jgi:hypothetical protein
MTIQWKADGITGTSYPGTRTAGKLMSVTTELSQALKSAVGKQVEVDLSANSLAFLLTSVSLYFPEVIRAMAAELEDYEPAPPGRYDFDYHARSIRLREAVLKGLSRYVRED